VGKQPTAPLSRSDEASHAIKPRCGRHNSFHDIDISQAFVNCWRDEAARKATQAPRLRVVPRQLQQWYALQY
jgi:hypothetical protein